MTFSNFTYLLQLLLIHLSKICERQDGCGVVKGRAVLREGFVHTAYFAPYFAPTVMTEVADCSATP